MSATVLYARVSTAEQTLAHQQIDAESKGYAFDHILADHGVSGVKTKLRERLEGRRIFDILRRGDTLVVRWIDRLGRDYGDVCETMRELMQRGVIVRTIINGMIFDGSTTDPMQMAVRDALIGFMAAMAQAQAEATKEAQRAGIAHAKAQAEASAYNGRKPSYSRVQFDAVVSGFDRGEAVAAIAKATGLTRQTVYRIRDNRADAEAALARWAARAAAA